MNLSKHFIAILVLFLVFHSCEDNPFPPGNYSIGGLVQKGPFINGTSILVNELNSQLGQNGNQFITNVTYNDGRFQLNNAEFGSSLVLLSATGNFHHELFGQQSAIPITLQAIVDLNGRSNFNVNVLTHVTLGRIEKLVSDGKTFPEAKIQAESEFLEFLGVSNDIEKGFEELDISNEEDENGILLAFSLIVQRYSWLRGDNETMVNFLIQLLSILRKDFRSDGIINETYVHNDLMINISRLKLIDIRENLESEYSMLLDQNEIPNFRIDSQTNGWKLITDSRGPTLLTQIENQLATTTLHLKNPGRVDLEYYINDTTTRYMYVGYAGIHLLRTNETAYKQTG